MNNSNVESKKTPCLKVYQTPVIEKILLDNEISLVLASDPPKGPDEVRNNTVPGYFKIDPYGNNA